MTISLPAAKRLCTAREFALVRSSRPRAVRALTDRAVQAHVERARKARDTFRDKARTQRREQRGTVRPRGGRPADGNQRTVAKEKLFAQVLAAFTAEVARRKAVEKAAKKSGKSAARPSRAAKNKTAGKTKANAKVKTKAQTKTKTKAKARTPGKRAAPRKSNPKRAKAPTPAKTASKPPSIAQPPQDSADNGVQANLAATHRPIPAITRRGRSLLATDISGKQSMKRIPRAQRRARYGSVSALGRRNQARRDSRG